MLWGLGLCKLWRWRETLILKRYHLSLIVVQMHTVRLNTQLVLTGRSTRLSLANLMLSRREPGMQDANMNIHMLDLELGL